MGKTRNPNKNNFRNKANKEASKGNYQDAFADKERGKRNKSVPIDCKTSDNDPSWYVPNGQMLKDVASIPFDYPTGRGFAGIYGDLVTPAQFTTPTPTDPGVLVLKYLPCVGDNPSSSSEAANTPLNTAMNQFYQLVRKSTSGTAYYEAPDLMMATMAIGSLYGYYSWMVRAYGLLNNFDLLNHYTPQTLLYAMGMDYDDLQANISDFRTYINQFAYRISAFALPDKFNFIKRAIFMNENVYMDASTRRAQYYIYQPMGFWKWTVEDATAEPTFEMNIEILPYAKPGSQLMTLADIIAFGNGLITPLLQSDDIRFMTADIIKAFGESSLLKALPIAETYHISPVYNSEVLSQIENATIFPAPRYSDGKYTWSVKSGAGLNNAYLYSTYKYHTSISVNVRSPYASDEMTALNNAYNVAYNAPDTLLNFHGIQNPTPEQIMVATRLQYSNVSVTQFVDSGDETYEEMQITFNGTLATEVVVGAMLLYAPWNPVSQSASGFTISTLQVNNTTGRSSLLTNQLNRLAKISKFDWHPRFVVFVLDMNETQTNKAVLTEDFFDYDDVAPISRTVLENLHYTALNGLFVGQLINA